MGIDIYARWESMTPQEEAAQLKVWTSIEGGDVGYLREAYHGEPYATRVLVEEAFLHAHGRASIAAELLQDRLPEVLELAERREREVYNETDPAEIERVLKSYRDFVALCARKEAETGQACLIYASW
jgi:hypothetical protein